MKNSVAIVGRPNVGKSCLFNRLLGKRKAIVESSSGVTRDRAYTRVQWGKKEFQLVDTGGIHFKTGCQITDAVIVQAEKALKDADLILLVVDSISGMVASDYEIIEFMRQFQKNVILVVNKVDNMLKINNINEFYKAGFSKIKFISALHGLNIDELCDEIVQELNLGDKKEPALEKPLKVAIIGRPNVGKSSFLNKILKEERAIVNNSPGTTRDSIDSQLIVNGEKYLMIDTAGIRHRKRPHKGIDIFSRSRTIESIKRADVCIVLIDAKMGVMGDDLHIFDLIKTEEKCCIIAVNKCDLVNIKLEDCVYTLGKKAPYMNFVFCVLCSAKSGKNLKFAITLVKHAWENTQKKIKQKKLAQTLEAIKEHVLQKHAQVSLKIHYLTQIKVNPPTFVVIVNRPELVKAQFLRFIENRLRKDYNFQGTPIRFVVKKKNKKKINK